MRLSRSIQLHPESASTHLFWRAHNKEFYLNDPSIKKLYLDCCKWASKKINRKQSLVEIHSYCLMSNHVHLNTTYKQSSSHLSEWMRNCHGRFGATYNRIHKRSGKVAESRPKTSLIQDTTYEMRVHFYIEANPIRAGICKLENLHLFRYSSYGYYAFGMRDECTHLLTPPHWYLALGTTNRERQVKYRRLFADYLQASKQTTQNFLNLLVGSQTWQIEMAQKIRQILMGLEKKSVPSDTT